MMAETEEKVIHGNDKSRRLVQCQIRASRQNRSYVCKPTWNRRNVYEVFQTGMAQLAGNGTEKWCGREVHGRNVGR